jgi:hypothetical protein
MTMNSNGTLRQSLFAVIGVAIFGWGLMWGLLAGFDALFCH